MHDARIQCEWTCLCLLSSAAGFREMFTQSVARVNVSQRGKYGLVSLHTLGWAGRNPVESKREPQKGFSGSLGVNGTIYCLLDEAWPAEFRIVLNVHRISHWFLHCFFGIDVLIPMNAYVLIFSFLGKWVMNNYTEYNAEYNALMEKYCIFSSF